MVERTASRGAHKGEKFYGCRAYPQCLGTRPYAAHVPAPDPDVVMERALTRDVPGGSARAMSSRRKAAHRDHVDSIRGRVLALGGLGVIVGLIWLASGTTILYFQPIFGLYLAGFSLLWVAGRLLITPQHIRSWETGADGEEKTARALESLPASWHVLHDRKIPRSVANIDHIVIGPPGVFVIESKDYAGDLSVAGGEIRVAGRKRTAWLGEVAREAEAVNRALADAGFSIETIAVLCVHRARLPFIRRSIEGVEIRNGSDLVPYLTKRPATLESSVADEVAAALDRVLKRAAA